MFISFYEYVCLFTANNKLVKLHFCCLIFAAMANFCTKKPYPHSRVTMAVVILLVIMSSCDGHGKQQHNNGQQGQTQQQQHQHQQQRQAPLRDTKHVHDKE